MALNQDDVHFFCCPKEGDKIECGVLNRVGILDFFCFKQNSGFQTLSGSPIPKYRSSKPLPVGVNHYIMNDEMT